MQTLEIPGLVPMEKEACQLIEGGGFFEFVDDVITGFAEGFLAMWKTYGRE